MVILVLRKQNEGWPCGGIVAAIFRDYGPLFIFSCSSFKTLTAASVFRLCTTSCIAIWLEMFPKRSTIACKFSKYASLFFFLNFLFFHQKNRVAKPHFLKSNLQHQQRQSKSLRHCNWFFHCLKCCRLVQQRGTQHSRFNIFRKCIFHSVSFLTL